MPRGIPKAKSDDSAMRYTTFHVPLPYAHYNLLHLTTTNTSLYLVCVIAATMHQAKPQAYGLELFEVGVERSLDTESKKGTRTRGAIHASIKILDF